MRLRGALFLLAVVVPFTGPGCREPTEITFAVSTDVPCTQIGHAAIAVGHVGAVETSPPASTSMECDASGHLGSIVVRPSGADDEEVAIRVTVGVGVDVSTCNPPGYGKGCIVARRALRFIPHTPLVVPIVMSADCEGQPCTADETCVQGTCKEASIGDSSQCATATGCGEGALPPASTGDAGPTSNVVPGCGDVGGLQAGAPWPMIGFCPTRRARGDAAGPATLTMKWLAPLDAAYSACQAPFDYCGPSSPIVAADGTIYVGGADGALYAFHPDGSRAWKAAVGGPVVWEGGAIGADGSVYVPSLDGHLYAIAPDGTTRWSFDAATPLNGSPAVAGDGSIYFLSTGGTLFAVDRHGQKEWTFPSTSQTITRHLLALSQDAKTVYFGTSHSVVAVNAGGPTKVFEFEVGSDVEGQSVAPDGTVFYTSRGGSGALTTAGAREWSTSSGSSLAPAVLADGTCLFDEYVSHAVHAFHPDGTSLWQRVLSGSPDGQPAVAANGNTYIADDFGKVYAIDPNGNLTASRPVAAASVPSGFNQFSTIALGGDGTLYVARADGVLLALGP